MRLSVWWVFLVFSLLLVTFPHQALAIVTSCEYDNECTVVKGTPQLTPGTCDIEWKDVGTYGGYDAWTRTVNGDPQLEIFPNGQVSGDCTSTSTDNTHWFQPYA